MLTAAVSMVRSTCFFLAAASAFFLALAAFASSLYRFFSSGVMLAPAAFAASGFDFSG